MSEQVRAITLTVNGEEVHETVDVRQSLVDFLRERLGLTGSHVGCEHGVCGACTVRLDGAIVRGCLVLAVQCAGTQVETIEGVSDRGEIADLQNTHPPQRAAMRILHRTCCSRRKICTHGNFAAHGGVPNRAIREYLCGNYCRCTDRRCRGSGGARTGAAMKITDDVAPNSLPSTGEFYIGRAGAAAEPRATHPGTRHMSATSCCRAWSTSPSCARPRPCAHQGDRCERRAERGGRDRRSYRRRACEGDHARSAC
jgi:carbon-monoxide dehydrogenase small subunit